VDCEHGFHFSGLVVGIVALVVGSEVLVFLFSGFYFDFDLTFSKPSVTDKGSKDFNSNPWSGIIHQGYWPRAY